MGDIYQHKCTQPDNILHHSTHSMQLSKQKLDDQTEATLDSSSLAAHMWETA